jgi:hypothetical protein
LVYIPYIASHRLNFLPLLPPTLKIPKAHNPFCHAPGVFPPNLSTGGRLIVYFPMGTCCPGVGLSSFLRNKLDILICPYIYLGSISHFYMPAHVISGKIHAKLYALIRQTSEFGTFLLRSLAFYKSPILLEFSSNGGLAQGGWGLFSTISLILVNIFHYSCRKNLLYLRPSTAQVTVQVPLLYPSSLSQKFNIFVTDVVYNIYLISMVPGLS